MVFQGAEECLVNRSALETMGHLVVSVEHVVQGIFLGLEPELIMPFDFAGNAVDGRFAGTVDEGFILGVMDGANTILELSGEEVVPGCVTAILGLGFTLVSLVERQGGKVPLELCEPKLAEPPCFTCVENALRLWVLEVGSPSK